MQASAGNWPWRMKEGHSRHWQKPQGGKGLVCYRNREECDGWERWKVAPSEAQTIQGLAADERAMGFVLKVMRSILGDGRVL